MLQSCGESGGEALRHGEYLTVSHVIRIHARRIAVVHPIECQGHLPGLRRLQQGYQCVQEPKCLAERVDAHS